MFAGKTVPSVVLSEIIPIVTSSVGSLFNTIVNVAVIKSSDVFPEIEETVIAATSLSIDVTVTSAAFLFL